MTCCEKCGYNIMFPEAIIVKGVLIELCRKCYDKVKENEEIPVSKDTD